MTEFSKTALETSFPTSEISVVSEQESWRKELNRPIYHIHKWWATRLGSVFRALVIGAFTEDTGDIWLKFYKKQNFEGKVVFDPFMGSGTTLGESIKAGAKAIGCDINPISSFLVKQAFRDVSIAELNKEFLRIKKDTEKKIQSYYKTIDPDTGEEIAVQHFFWVKVAYTPQGEAIPLFSKYIFSQDAYPKRKPIVQIICAKCWQISSGLHDDLVHTCSTCGNTFNPQEGPASGQSVADSNGIVYKIKDLLPEKETFHEQLYAMLAINSKGKKIYLPITQRDIDIYNKATQDLLLEDLPLPDLMIRSGHNTDQARSYNYSHWRDFFNDRQLICLGILLKRILQISDEAIRDQFLCLFSSTLEFNNMFCSFKGEGTGAVRHMFSNHILKPERTPLENCIWGTARSSGTFSSLFESRLLRAKEYLKEPFEVSKSGKVIASDPIDIPTFLEWHDFEAASKGVLIYSQDSSRLPIPSNSVDAVITDPPYFDYIHYSELSDFFFAWLAPVLKNSYPEFCRDNSSSEFEVQDKSPFLFSSQLGRVFKECYRMMKEDAILAFSFHHSRPDGWASIYQAISVASLDITAIHFVHAEMRSSSPKSSAKAPISLDAVIVCRKARKVPMTLKSEQAVIREAEEELERLLCAGMKISSGDVFVVLAAKVLQHLPHSSGYEGAKAAIEKIMLSDKVVSLHSWLSSSSK